LLSFLSPRDAEAATEDYAGGGAGATIADPDADADALADITNSNSNANAESPSRIAAGSAPPRAVLPDGGGGGGLDHGTSVVAGAGVGAESSSRPPRKGDVVCLSYRTLDDRGMRRLEGRSDHRPVIGVYAIYV